MDKFVYVAVEKCGCITGVCGTDYKNTAEDVADFIRSGRHVERMSLEAFQEKEFGCKCQSEFNLDTGSLPSQG